jgi:beta-glucanase (GH16 family)
MIKKMHISIFLFFLLVAQYGFAQVDVVYNNLVWSDEFDTNGIVNSVNWFHQTQLPSGGGWFNGEVQHYTNLPTNSFVQDGYLHIVAKNETFTDQGVTKQYTSARLNSKFAFKYGRVDVRAKIPLEAGTWPAIWMLGKNVNEPGGYFSTAFGTTDWPACGETDIMEHGIFPSQSVNYIQSTIHTPSSFGNSINNGGIVASDLANSFHIYSVNWSPFQISFLVDGVVFYTYNPAIKDATTWPFDKEQFLLLNIAMGGIAGTIPSNFSQATMDIDYVRVYQNTSIDTLPPTNFTASVGSVTSSSVELLLNANDDSGAIAYSISYDSQTVSTSGTSGTQKSVVISGLSPDTSYSFTITASDLSSNIALNSPLNLNATTTSVIACGGTSNLAQQGTFSTGYNYTFETIGNDVKITFELLDTGRVGLVAYLWKQSPFAETPMTNVSGTVFTKTISGQMIGSTISYAVKFAYAGGLSVTNYFQYLIGNNCSLGLENVINDNDFSFTNPAHDYIDINSAFQVDKVVIYDLLGKVIFNTTIDTKRINISNVSKGIYLMAVFSGTQKIIKKIVVN